MRNTLTIFIPVITLFSSSSFGFFCPTNFNQIEAGFSTAQVIALCGKPDKTEDAEVKPFLPQEWVYYIPQTVSTDSLQQTQGTLQTSFSFNKDKKAINISVNGIGVGATTICGGTNIQLDDDTDKVKQACGKPVFINEAKESTLEKEEQSTKVTTFIYSKPPTKLTFENDKLTKQE